MNNPKAIITKRKKKLRVGMAVFNKKAGIWEWQVKEGNVIIKREPVETMNARHEEEIGDFKATSMRDRAQESLKNLKNKKK